MGLHCPDCSISESVALFIQVEVCKYKTPSRLNMETYSRKAPFEHLQSTDWHLFQTWTHKREIQKEALSKIKTREHPTEDKSGNSRVLVNFPVLSLTWALHSIVLHSLPLNWITHSLVCTLVVEGPVSGSVRCQVCTPKDLWGFYTFCFFIDLWSNTLLIKIQRL